MIKTRLIKETDILMDDHLVRAQNLLASMNPLTAHQQAVVAHVRENQRYTVPEMPMSDSQRHLKQIKDDYLREEVRWRNDPVRSVLVHGVLWLIESVPSRTLF